MHETIERFLSTLRDEKGYSDNTIVAYRNDLSQFLDYLNEEGCADGWDAVSETDLQDYVDCLKFEHEYASATVARKVAATKSFFRYLASEGAVDQDPSASLDSPKVRKYLPTSISQQEVERLLQAPRKAQGMRAVRDSALLEILYATGMRVSEVVALDVDDVDIAGGSVHCSSRSGRGRERQIPIYPRAVDALGAYVNEARKRLLDDKEESALFLNHRGRRLTRQGLWLIIKKYVEESGVSSSVTPHTLRHTFATHLLNGGADVHEVQGLLGHANVSTTQVYTQISDERLREVYDDAHPWAE